MSYYLNMHIIIVGTGPMAEAYIEVLKELRVKITVVGRGESSAKLFEQRTGIKPFLGGIENYFESNPPRENDYIIIAVGTEALMPILKLLIKRQFNRVLVEKPAAISIEELLSNKIFLKPIEKKVFVAYNRRFYASVVEAQKVIEEDGGLLSVHFEFTEWSHKIGPLSKAPGVKENWFFANSTHVIDLAFFLSGLPTRWSSFTKPGSIPWHTTSVFAGAGVTKNGVLFSYFSNWESAGRWSVELMTDKRRLFLKPLEELWQQKRGQIDTLKIELPASVDSNFKPGLFRQVVEFLEGPTSRLQTLEHHMQSSEFVYQEMLNSSASGKQ